MTQKSVELLAPAGNWESMKAAVEAGADAVYLGGKHFNMRMHDGDFNFTDEKLKEAVQYAHERDVKLYVTVNNLISDEEIEELKSYLAYLDEIRPDAILTQDLAVIALHKELNMQIPLHASVMMNTHNEPMARWLKKQGVSRIVAGREMTLSELSLLKERVGMEIEYFIHGDMCIAESGQCIHSGVLFGQSSSRGRCLKPCRWPYKLIDEKSGEILDNDGPGAYKLALKDMCLYRNLRELIQAGVYSFKIEGRMRPPEFVRRLTGLYRRAIDAYLEDPMGSIKVIEEGWQEIYKNRVRDFTTAFALGQPTAADIGFTGEREPRFFSKAVPEAGFADEILKNERSAKRDKKIKGRLSVRVATVESAKNALENGADAVYVGGEAYRPLRPWTYADYEQCRELTNQHNAKMILLTPRTTARYELGELVQFLKRMEKIKPDGIVAGNIGMFETICQTTDLPVQADSSFNLFNHVTADFWKKQGVTMMTASLELSFAQLRTIAENSTMPIEVIVHGATESMICDHNIAAMSLPAYNGLVNPEIMDIHYALKDEAEEIHPLRYDQYGRAHIYFAHDLCLYPYLDKFDFAASYRIEAQDYEPDLVAYVTKLYRNRLDNPTNTTFDDTMEELAKRSPRPLGIGIYRYRQSRNSI